MVYIGGAGVDSEAGTEKLRHQFLRSFHEVVQSQ